MKLTYLREHLSFDQAKAVVESDDKDGKSLYLKGIAIQGGIRNANQRVYPVDEIERAVKTLNDQIQNACQEKSDERNIKPSSLNIYTVNVLWGILICLFMHTYKKL